ncbi:hypothetical protein K2173_009655 [Erythroxylum novogranatense]|uniref:DM2 domain-containing protein n=1 Tax=Erythroxylum novogranatense TaxID=1862640 RepID=A0AAV8U809_9ROSI|nr:hypothetical protein K2173_009655 [Erythroxylum novogranatense]
MAARIGTGKFGKRVLVKRPAYSPLGSVVNAQLKNRQIPSSSSNLGKFLGIPPPPRSDLTKLFAKFVKLNSRENPGAMKKNFLTEDKLRSLLAGKDKVGTPEIAKLLSQQFTKG